MDTDTQSSVVDWTPGNYSRARFFDSLRKWGVPVTSDWGDVLWRYYGHGLPPGSFFEGMLANDMSAAMAHCHPGNRIDVIKATMGWLDYSGMWNIAWGNHKTVEAWLRMDQQRRMEYLIRFNLAFDPREEVWKSLRGDPVILEVDYAF